MAKAKQTKAQAIQEARERLMKRAGGKWREVAPRAKTPHEEEYDALANRIGAAVNELNNALDASREFYGMSAHVTLREDEGTQHFMYTIYKLTHATMLFKVAVAKTDDDPAAKAA